MKRSKLLKRAAIGSATPALQPLAAPAAQASTAVSVLYAASLVTVMESVIRPAVAKRGLDFRGEGKGSVALANLIASGLRAPDVFVSADARVFDPLTTAALVTWYATFATTRLLIGYAAASPFARDFVAVDRREKKLTDVLLQPGLKLGRTDPALDPKGYRSILVAQLLGATEGVAPDFARRLLGDDRNAAQVLPEETLLARLETGDLDAGFLYGTESAARHLPTIEFPAAVNLGDPAHARHYATASVTVAGRTWTGAPAAYALTIPAVAQNKAAAAAFVAFLLGKAGRRLLDDAGVTTIRPIVAGDTTAVPANVRAVLGG